jgi:hypothetical protein
MPIITDLGMWKCIDVDDSKDMMILTGSTVKSYTVCYTDENYVCFLKVCACRWLLLKQAKDWLM